MQYIIIPENIDNDNTTNNRKGMRIMRIRNIDDLRLSEVVKNFCKERGVFTTEDLARVFLDERGSFNNDLFKEILYELRCSQTEWQTIRRAVYKSGYYHDIEGRPADPIIFYGETSEPNPCWRPVDVPARTVIEIDRIKQSLIVKYYNKYDDSNGSHYNIVSTTRATVDPELCERFFKRLELAGDMKHEHIFDANNDKDILIRRGSGRKTRDRGIFDQEHLESARRAILEKAHVIDNRYLINK